MSPKMKLHLLSDYMRNSFINEGYFEVISREQLNRIMNEYKMEESGLTSESNAIELGKLLNAKNSVVGTIGKFGKVYVINIQLMDMETGKYIVAESIQADSKEDALKQIKNKVDIFASRLNGNKTTAQENWVRPFYFPVDILEGGLGGEIGFGWYFTDFFHAYVEGGAIYLLTPGSVVPEAETGVGFSFLKLGDFRFWVDGAALGSFTSQEFIVSPVLKLEISYLGFFVSGGARYGTTTSQVYPMLSFGVRI